MAKIRIVGDSSGYVELAAPNAAGNNTLELPASGTKLVGADANGAITVGTGASVSSPATNVLTLGTNNVERVRVDSSGRLGIGTVNPSSKLDVWGPQRTSGAINPTDGNALRLAFDGGSNSNDFGSSILFSQRYDTIDRTQIGVGQISGIKIAQSGSFGGGLVFSTSDGTNNNLTERVRITDAGLVGIGTTTIDNKLSVGGETAQFPVSIQIYSTLHSTSRRAAIGLGGTPGNTTPDWLILQDRTGNGTKNFGIYNTTISESPFTISSGQITEPTYYVSTPNSSTGATYGLDIGYRRAVVISGNVSANTWTNSGITQKSTGDQGIFLLDVWVDTYNAGGQAYQTSYVGWFVLPNRNSNSVNTSTITVHYTGHAPNAEVFQFRTLNEMDASGGRIYLQFSTNFSLTGLDGTSGKNVTISIHRFGSPINNV